ncbi:hypothetical protein LXL04_037171 [Taraxacum kok-saghyz]
MGDNAAGEGWQTVTRRKNLRYNNGGNKDETSIFIANIPEDCTKAILWKIFNSFGKLVDAYIPPRKSKVGKKFGFLKFLFVKDPQQLGGQHKGSQNRWHED